jgi:hypothetical protein
LEPGEDELVVLERIFFSSSSGGTPETIGLPGWPSYGTSCFDGLTVLWHCLSWEFRIT